MKRQIPIEITDAIVTSRDGAALRAWSAGAGPGPTLVLANSLVGGIDGWRELVDAFASRHQLIGWSYRGLLDDNAPGASVEQHAADMVDVMRHYGVTSAVAVGWSGGARVVLQAARDNTDRFDALVLVCGLLQRPLQRLADPIIGPLSAFAPKIGELAGELAAYAPQLWRVAAVGARSRAVQELLKLIGAVSQTAPSKRVEELLADTTALPLHRLTAMIRATDAHVLAHPMPQLAQPVLFIGGSADPLCPPADVLQAASDTQAADTMIVPSAGQLLPIEFPELLHLRLAKFIRARLGFDPIAAQRADQR